MTIDPDKLPVTVIEGSRSWQLINFAELKAYRDLAYFLVWRDITVMYAQTILGVAWAIIQPLVQIALFSIIFGKIAKIPTGDIPYVLFATVAIIPWTYISTSMMQSSQSLVANQHMLGKIYFPRLLFPMTPIIAQLLNFGISIILLVAIMIYYQVTPTWNLAYLPIFILMMMLIPAGGGLWLSALAIRYRDVKFAMQYVIQMLMYTAPIIYSASSIPEQYRIFYSLNPIVGVIEGFRASLLGADIPWLYVAPGMVTAILLFVTGAIYFKRMERVFADVI
ncbi:MAG: ABC-type polysaccharide/polyol phosphate export systems permease [Gammaproteobacteria bacterium]|nr:MAG: ABC-type polysaccharide/polyol phosphate export systems permease [Gammaproteobacteria bacterium]TND05343.1 MAG: ABC-type polysaccharide/polyol phosphate export systems permease [Gammaproteobacteria bacterium]